MTYINSEYQKESARKRARKWREDNPERSRANGIRSHYNKKWNLTIEEIDAMILAQGGVCLICEKPEKKNIRLSIDHDHKTGKIRGLLCTHCNWRLLGGSGDSPEFYERVVKYLRGTLL